MVFAEIMSWRHVLHYLHALTRSRAAPRVRARGVY